MPYKLEGRLLEACTCNAICPCWIGEDPDGGSCDGTMAWHIDKGSVNGVDVSGHTIALIVHIPGNVLKGNWNARVYVDDKASTAQKDALLSVWTGKEGGPVADMAKLVGRVDSVEQVPITFQIQGAKGTFKIGQALDAAVEPIMGASGKESAMTNAVFSSIPGSPEYLGKASRLRVKAPGFDVDIKNHSAVSGKFMLST